MIVEFVGSSGAGKTTLSTMLRQRTDLNSRVIPITDLVTDRPGRRWIRDPTAVDLVADVTVFPRFVRSLDRHRGFVRFAFDRLNRHAPSRFAKVNYKREIARHIGLHELARHRAGGATVLADEGTVLTAYHLFAYSDAPFGRADLERFARLVPLPDRIVYVRAPLEVLVERALRRPDRRRELAADDREQLERSISRAIEVFEGLATVPAIRERLLIVDDGSPDGQERALAEIAAFVSTRDGTTARTPEASRRAGPAGGSHVIAFVGSEATGKSTILHEVDGWLGARYTVRRIHAGKPPATALTFVPHVLLPAFRTLFPEQRSLRVEARYQGTDAPPAQTYPVMFALRSVMLAYERWRLLTRARSAGGTIVLSDRYPSSRSGAMDGPQLTHLPREGSLRRWSAWLEARLYADIPHPDLVIHLTAPLEVTLSRNAARDKTEPEDYVRWRHALSSDLEFDGAPVRRIDTDRPLEVVVGEVEGAIRDALPSRPTGEDRMGQEAPESLRGGPLRRGRTTFPEGGRAMRRARVLKRLRRIGVKDLEGVLDRARTWLRRLWTRHPTSRKRPVFVVGCNRSGTNMVCKAIGRSPHGWDYPERELSLAFNGYYLRSDRIIERLIRLTPAPLVSFGSILDSQFTDDLLSRFDGARAIWIYRRYRDVATSCAHMTWGPSLKDMVGWVARGETERLGARGKRISAETVQLFGELYREDLSTEEGACLYWYLRNRLYFDLGLHADPRVLLVQYEDAVMDTERAFGRIFDFLGFPLDPGITDEVYATSVGRYPWPGIDPAIERVCDALQAELDARFAADRPTLP